MLSKENKHCELRAIEPITIMSNQFVIDVCQIIFGGTEAWFVAKTNKISFYNKQLEKKSVENWFIFFKIKLLFALLSI